MYSMRTAAILLSATMGVIAVAGAAATPTVMAASDAPQSVTEKHSPADSAAVIEQSAVAAVVDTRSSTPVVKPCKDRLVRLLRRAGFTGENVREAWAIAMRESNGQPRLGPGHPSFNGSDYGLFQWNQKSWGDKKWFDTTKLLNGLYNARLAYRMSDGGDNWVHWGLTGAGETDITSYAGIWSPDQIYRWITEPYQRYVKQFDELPKACRKN